MKHSVRERILDTALDLFQQKGYHGVSVDEIVEQANTSKGGFYHNFKSKDALLYELHDMFISNVLKEAKIMHEEEGSPIQKLYTMLCASTNAFEVYNRHIIVFYNESAYLQAAYKETINQKRTAYRKLFEHVIEEGKQRNLFRPEISTVITAMAINGMVNWTYKWYKKNGPLSMHEITHYFNDIILRGIVTEQGFQEAIQLGYIQ